MTGVVLALFVTGPGSTWSNVLDRARIDWRRWFPVKMETIWFVDGPLAGRMDRIPAGRDGLPPHQFCAVVTRSAHDGGDYTMPYQRGPMSESKKAWQYTQGWTHRHAPVQVPFSSPTR